MGDNLVEYDIRLRQAGKTYDLIEWWREAPQSRRIVVPDMQQARYVTDAALLNSARRTTIAYTFDEARQGQLLRGRGDVEVGVDNLDMILARMMPANALLRRVSATGLLADATLLALRDA